MKALAQFLAYRAHATPKDSAQFVALFERVHQDLQHGHTLSVLPASAQAIPHLLISEDEAQNGAIAPLVFSGNRVWLYRSWKAERQIHALIHQRLHTQTHTQEIALDERFLAHLNEAQKQAITQSLRSTLTVINGGPGTGKTYTIAHLVAMLTQNMPRIALAAPTGKAAKRMEESLHAALISLFPDTPPPNLAGAQTLHRLLKIDTNGHTPFHENAPLPYDFVIVDEASMLSLEMANRLLSACAAHTHLILLGDIYQLAAVDPGMVLRDILQLPEMRAHTVFLTESKRFNHHSGIAHLANYILGKEADCTPAFTAPDINYHLEFTRDFYQHILAPYLPYLEAVRSGADKERLFALLNAYQILLATHNGALGTRKVNQEARLFARQVLGTSEQPFFHGQVLMVNTNDKNNQIFNGDIGICLRQDEGHLALALPNKDEAIALTRIPRPHLEDAYALTIHKSQGSEFRRVCLAFDKKQQHILSQELLYTGITRAKEAIDLYCAPELLRYAKDHPIIRHTGGNAPLIA